MARATFRGTTTQIIEADNPENKRFAKCEFGDKFVGDLVAFTQSECIRIPSPFMSSHDSSRRPANDAMLLARLREGDEAAFETLVRSYVGPLIRYATRLVASADYAQEIVQDTLFQLWCDRDKVQPSWDIAAYLYWATRNRAIKATRWERSTSQREGRWVAEREIEIGDRGGHSGEAALEIAELRAQVWEALSDVPPRCREIFMLVWDRQLPYDQIAQQLGLAEPTVRSQVSRALKRVVAVLGPRYGSGNIPE